MAFRARYYDGETARASAVTCHRDDSGTQLLIYDKQSTGQIAAWPINTLKGLGGANPPAPITSTEHAMARLVPVSENEARQARLEIPELGVLGRRQNRRQTLIIGLATAALALVGGGYLFGMPLLARQIAAIVPADWEIQLGETASHQIESIMGGKDGFTLCDPDRHSVANRAIAAFADKALGEMTLPYKIKVNMVRADIANAFALPGGDIYYFSAMLRRTRSQEEFAGILAHEVGHVVHKHGLEMLISTSGTGLLVGFMLGDLSGLSVAGGLGAQLVDSRNSRRAEREADAFAKQVASRLGYDSAALGALLERLSGDDDFNGVVALLSSHPMTSERREALEQTDGAKGANRPFTDAQWQAISTMCVKEAPQ